MTAFRRVHVLARIAFLAAAVALAAGTAQAQVSLAPLSSFGGGDGWFAPAEGGYAFLGIANNERGLGYGNGHVYLVSRSGGNFIRLLDPLTGLDLGTLNTTGITGGTFAVNTIAVGGDGAIYVNNLTVQSTTTPLKIYKWATEASAPTVAYSGDAGLAGSRVGDSIAGIGGGSSTRLALGYNSSPSVAGNNGYAIIDPTASTGTAIGFPGTPPNAGDFRLGITFVDASHVLGTVGSSLYRYTSFSGTSGTLIGSPAIPDPAGATADRILAYTVLGGIPLLAILSIGNAHVSLYDVSDPSSPVYLTSGNNTSGALTANGNGTGEIAWGDVTAGGGISTQTLYAMSTNQGIQAFTVSVTVPEPATVAFLGISFGLLATLRRRRSN
jgi:hypothetical protein